MQIEKMQNYLKIIKKLIGSDKGSIHPLPYSGENGYTQYVNNLFNIFLGDSRIFLSFMERYSDIKNILSHGKSRYPNAECGEKIEIMTERMDIFTATPNAKKFWTRKSVIGEYELRELTGIGECNDRELNETFDKMIEASSVYLQSSNEDTLNLKEKLDKYGYSKPIPEDGIIFLCNNTSFLQFANCLLISSMDVDDQFCDDLTRIMKASKQHEMIQSVEERREYRKIARITKRNLSMKRKKGQIMSKHKTASLAA